MKTMIRLTVLVAILCAFTAPQASAQGPHSKVWGSYSFPFGAVSPFSAPTGQSTYISIITTGGTLELPLGISKKEVSLEVGGPFYTSILRKHQVICFDAMNALVRCAMTEEDEPEETPKPEEAKTPPGGG